MQLTQQLTKIANAVNDSKHREYVQSMRTFIKNVTSTEDFELALVKAANSGFYFINLNQLWSSAQYAEYLNYFKMLTTEVKREFNKQLKKYGAELSANGRTILW